MYSLYDLFHMPINDVINLFLLKCVNVIKSDEFILIFGLCISFSLLVYGVKLLRICYK